MKNINSAIFFFIIFLLSFFAEAQVTEKVFFDLNGKKTDSLNFHTYTITTFADKDRKSAIRETYYKNHQLKLSSSVIFIDSVTSHLNGSYKLYYENGKIKEDLVYVENNLHGLIKTYYPSGQLRREDRFEMNELITGKCYSTTGMDTAYFHFFKLPKYPGGDHSISQFIGSNLKYPKKAIWNGQEGRVFVSFIVNKAGKVENIKVEKSVSELLDNEALRVVSKLQGFEPAEYEGYKVTYRYIVPVKFRLQ